MRETTVWAIVATLVAALIAMAIFLGFQWTDTRRRESYELRKSYVEKCKLTPTQAEKLLPETP